jgi:hypothetical protein
MAAHNWLGPRLIQLLLAQIPADEGAAIASGTWPQLPPSWEVKLLREGGWL